MTSVHSKCQGCERPGKTETKGTVTAAMVVFLVYVWNKMLKLTSLILF